MRTLAVVAALFAVLSSPAPAAPETMHPTPGLHYPFITEGCEIVWMPESEYQEFLGDWMEWVSRCVWPACEGDIYHYVTPLSFFNDPDEPCGNQWARPCTELEPQYLDKTQIEDLEWGCALYQYSKLPVGWEHLYCQWFLQRCLPACDCTGLPE